MTSRPDDKPTVDNIGKFSRCTDNARQQVLRRERWVELSEQEEAFVREIRRIFSAPAVDDQYDQLDGSFGGRVLNADLARELSRDYRNKYGRLAFTRCSYAPCAEYVLNRFRRIIGMPGPTGTRTALFLAGGAASGKTTSVGPKTIEAYDLVFDSNLAGFEKAKMIVTESLQAGWLVDVTYIHRPYSLAVRSMIERALENGRYIPLGQPSKLARLHLDAQRTIVRLARAFAKQRSDRLVDVDAFANLWTPEKPVPASPISLSELEYGGQYHYKTLEELHAIEAKIVASLREENVSEHAVFQALAENEA